MSFKIEITPESQRILNGLAKAGKVDLRPALETVGVSYRKEVSLIFNKKQSRGEGDKWQPLSVKYAAWKNKNYPGQPILVRTGRLRASMITKGSDGNITVIGKTGAIFGSSVDYGIYHDKGGNKMPRRNFSEPSERREQIMIEQIGASIRHNFEQNGIEVSGSLFI